MSALGPSFMCSTPWNREADAAKTRISGLVMVLSCPCQPNLRFHFMPFMPSKMRFKDSLSERVASGGAS